MAHRRLLKSILFHNPNPNPLLLLSNHFSSLSDNPVSTPISSQFQLWTHQLRPPITPTALTTALSSISDPDLAFDIFRWSSLSTPSFRHTPHTYHSILHILIRSRRFADAELLLHEVLSGAVPPHRDLLNLLFKFCASRRHLFSTAFDLYKKMTAAANGGDAECRPDLTTYSYLLTMLLRRFGKPPVCYVHMHAVRSLVKQMKINGVIPDIYVLNLIIKAYSRCLEMDEALRVYREMGLYNCEPNGYTYGYLVKGLCERGRVNEGMKYLKEMREKGLLPTSGIYMTTICSLAMERRFEEGKEVMMDMLENGMKADLLTYRTFLEGLCREGRVDEAFECLDELGKVKGAMDRRMYSSLLDGLHWINQPHS